MRGLATHWERLGGYLGRRPAAIIGFIVGAVAFITIMTVLFVQQQDTSRDLRKVQTAFCNGRAPYTPQIETNCRKLLNQLLKNPSPEQARRLREIVQEAK